MTILTQWGNRKFVNFYHGEVVLVTEYYIRPTHLGKDGAIVPEKHLSRILEGTIGSESVVNGLYQVHISGLYRWKQFFEYEISKWR